MKKFGIIAVVILLAVSGVIAAMAYNDASIVSNADLKITSTDSALLQLRHPRGQAGAVGSKDATYTIKDGEMYIRFGVGVKRDGTTEQMYGLQPNSTYEWNPLFTIANMSAEKLEITVAASENIAGYITFGDMGQVGGGVHAPKWGTKGDPLVKTVNKETNSGMQNLLGVAVRVELPSGVALETLNGQITVSAKAIP